MKHPFLLGLVACAALAARPSLLPADDSHPMASAARTLPYVHLYADANGISHFRDAKLTLSAAPSPTGTPGDQA